MRLRLGMVERVLIRSHQIGRQLSPDGFGARLAGRGRVPWTTTSPRFRMRVIVTGAR